MANRNRMTRDPDNRELGVHRRQQEEEHRRGYERQPQSEDEWADWVALQKWPDEEDHPRRLETLKAARAEVESGDLVPAEDVLAELDEMLR